MNNEQTIATEAEINALCDHHEALTDTANHLHAQSLMLMARLWSHSNRARYFGDRARLARLDHAFTRAERRNARRWATSQRLSRELDEALAPYDHNNNN